MYIASLYLSVAIGDTDSPDIPISTASDLAGFEVGVEWKTGKLMTSCLRLLTLFIWKSHLNEINRNLEGDVHPIFYLNIKATLTFSWRFLPLGIRLRACNTHLIIISSFGQQKLSKFVVAFWFETQFRFNLVPNNECRFFNRMALFFSSLRGLPHFGGKPKDDAIFDVSKNGRQWLRGTL